MARRLEQEEIRQRVCRYCLDKKMITISKGCNVIGCSFKECPYHELDDISTYDEFLQKIDETPYNFDIFAGLGLGDRPNIL